MHRLTRLMGLGILGLTLVVGVGVSGDKKDKDPPKGKTPSLPAGWKALKLSKDQIEKVHAISSEYNGKIEELTDKIAALKAQRTAEQVKVLTAEQKAQYLKGLTGDDTKDKAPPKDKAVVKDTPPKDKGDKDK